MEQPSRTSPQTRNLIEIAERIGETVAGPASRDVDFNARFPVETVDALKREKLLSAVIPTELGGMGASVAEMSDVVRVLSHYCTSSALVLAMHTIEVYTLVRYGTTPSLQTLIKRIVDEQILLANDPPLTAAPHWCERVKLRASTARPWRAPTG